MIAFFVKGRARAWARPRFNRKTGAVFTDKDTREWEKHVFRTWVTLREDTILGPLSVDMTFYFRRPKSHYKADGYSLSKAGDGAIPRGDVDNLAKAVMDALNGEAFIDDRYVLCLTTRKEWVRNDGEEGVHVELHPLSVLRHEHLPALKPPLLHES